MPQRGHNDPGRWAVCGCERGTNTRADRDANANAGTAADAGGRRDLQILTWTQSDGSSTDAEARCRGGCRRAPWHMYGHTWSNLASTSPGLHTIKDNWMTAHNCRRREIRSPLIVPSCTEPVCVPSWSTSLTQAERLGAPLGIASLRWRFPDGDARRSSNNFSNMLLRRAAPHQPLTTPNIRTY